MTISIVVAKSKNDVIGRDNKLPWHLPEDLKFFKRLTTHHHVIMGRKTFESMNSKPLPNRTNIILTTKPDYHVPLGCHIASSLEEALEISKQNGETHAFIIGGSQVYSLAIPIVDSMYITEVDTEVEGDTFFPSLMRDDWSETISEHHRADDNNPYPFTIKIYTANKGKL